MHTTPDSDRILDDLRRVVEDAESLLRETSGLVGERAHDAVLIGELRASIARDWEGSVACHPVDSLEAAVEQARALARPGDTVLFSPGTSSFDMFRSYEERGDAFKNLSHQLQPTKHTS